MVIYDYFIYIHRDFYKLNYNTTKKLTLVLFAVIPFISAFSQLTVEKSYVVLDGRMQFRGNGHTLRIAPDNPGTEIGTSSGRLDFWYTGIGYNSLYAKKFYTQSDRRTKDNITPLNNCLNKVLKLNTYSYSLKTGANKRNTSDNKEFGLIAQELEKVIPSLVSSSKDIKLINYDGLIPFLIEAIKEQQKQIDALQTVIMSQERDIIEAKNSQSESRVVDNNSSPILYNNAPNPFKENTEIKCYLPNNFLSAQIMICDLQGKQVKIYSSLHTGDNTINIDAAELYEGMFIYSLIIDGNIVDSKRMVVTK